MRAVDPATFNHDVGWILACAERILDGARYPVDWLDPNPPGIFWASVVPVAIARALGIAPIAVYDAGILAAALASSAACAWIARRMLPDAPVGFAPALAGWLAAALVLLPRYEFGQREHIAAIATLPYFAAAARALAGRPLGTRAGLAVGAAAGIGLAIKPFFLLAPGVVALWLCLTQGARALFRAEHLAIAAIQLGYAAALAAFAPGYAEVAALAWRTLDAYDYPWIAFVANRATLALGVAAVFALALRGSADTRPLRRVWLAAAGAFWVAACLQRRGWTYHFLPAELVAAALLGLCWLETIAREARTRFVAVAFAGALLWSGGALALELAAGRPTPRPSLVGALAHTIRDLAPGEPVLFLSTAVGPAFPAVNVAGARWASRWSCLWPLPALYSPAEWAAQPFPYRAPDAIGPDERAFVDAVVADLERHRPALIFVDRARVRQAIGESAFDFVAYFSRDPRFAARFADYLEIGEMPRFRVYQRVAEAAR